MCIRDRSYEATLRAKDQYASRLVDALAEFSQMTVCPTAEVMCDKEQNRFRARPVSSCSGSHAIGPGGIPGHVRRNRPEIPGVCLSLIHISEPTRRTPISYA